MIRSTCPMTAKPIELDINMEAAALAEIWDRQACTRCRTRCDMSCSSSARRFKIRDAMVTGILMSSMPGA